MDAVVKADVQPAAGARVAEAVLPESYEVAGEGVVGAEGGDEIEVSDEWDGDGGDQVAKVIHVYAEILDDLKDRLESLDDVQLCLQKLDKALADIAELQNGSQQQANAYIAETHRLLHQWLFLPTPHRLHRLGKEFTDLITGRRQEAGLRKQPRKRWAAWKNPLPPRDSAEANRVIYRVIKEVMDKLGGLASRGCIEYHLIVVNKYKGNMQLVGESKRLRGLSEVLQFRTCVDAFIPLCAQQQRVANLAGIQGVTFSKLDADEQRSAVNTILAVIAPKRQQLCPFKPARKPARTGSEQQPPAGAAADPLPAGAAAEQPDVGAAAEQPLAAAEQPPAGAAAEPADAAAVDGKALWSQHYFAWPAGLPYVSVRNQTEAGLLQLFEAASAAVGARWPQVLFEARKVLEAKHGSCERIVEALNDAERGEAARARAAQPLSADTGERDAAEPVLGQAAGEDPALQAAADGVAGTPLPYSGMSADRLQSACLEVTYDLFVYLLGPDAENSSLINACLTGLRAPFLAAAPWWENERMQNACLTGLQAPCQLL